MKRTFLVSITFLFILSSCSYEPGVSEAFAKYRFKDGITTVTVPGWVLHLAARIGDLKESERELLESIDKVRIIAVDDDELNDRIDLHKEYYKKISESKGYEELLVVRDEEESVTIFGRMNDESVIRELLVLVGGDENAIVYIKGEIRPELLNDKINLSDTDKLLSFRF